KSRPGCVSLGSVFGVIERVVPMAGEPNPAVLEHNHLADAERPPAGLAEGLRGDDDAAILGLAFNIDAHRRVFEMMSTLSEDVNRTIAETFPAAPVVVAEQPLAVAQQTIELAQAVQQHKLLM